jgi:hypothetical protein
LRIPHAPVIRPQPADVTPELYEFSLVRFRDGFLEAYAKPGC